MESDFFNLVSGQQHLVQTLVITKLPIINQLYQKTTHILCGKLIVKWNEKHIYDWQFLSLLINVCLCLGFEALTCGIRP